MTDYEVTNVVVLGGGLASALCALALVKNLPSRIKITWVETDSTSTRDLFYGTVASPNFYSLLVKLGVSEPEILLNTNSNLSYGTQYKNWAHTSKSWVQSYNKSLPVIDGIAFHQLVTRYSQLVTDTPKIDQYLMSSVAALNGVFAHPRGDLNTPLSSAEYGFNLVPSEWADFLAILIKPLNLQHIKSDVEDVERDETTITSIKLRNGNSIKADFFVDCRAHAGTPLVDTSENWTSRKVLKAEAWTETSNLSQSGTRVILSETDGWIAQTPLQGKVQSLKVSSGNSADSRDSDNCKDGSFVELSQLGFSNAPWVGNALSIGHAAALIEPLTPAPLMMLQADIERLLELFPISKTMSVEQKEYNRRFNNDLTHLQIFQQSFFKLNNLPEGSYWCEAAMEPMNEKLTKKIEQFQNRGVLVNYDYEPFENQDWVTLHFGLGRIPTRYDPLADKIEFKSMVSILTEMRAAISELSQKMPPHSVYMKRFLEYLRKKYA